MTSAPYADATRKPLAVLGLTSYRYRGFYGWIMIGARSDADALKEAARSSSHPIDPRNLQRWNGAEYVDVTP